MPRGSRDSDPSTRTLSLASSLHLDTPSTDPYAVYRAVLKGVLLEYVCEARFTTPQTPQPKPDVRRLRLSRFESDALLPPSLIPDLKAKLHRVAMKKSTKKSSYDDATRRSLLRFYSDMLDPAFSTELRRANAIDVLVMKFVLCANKEVVKLAHCAPDAVSTEVFRHTETFVDIVVKLVEREKNADQLVAKLNEHRSSLKPKLVLPLKNMAQSASSAASYVAPSFVLKDMDQAYIALLKDLFSLTDSDLQKDIDALKPLVTPKCLAKDIEQVSFYLSKDIGTFSPRDFASQEAYDSWKLREESLCEGLVKKYPVPPPHRLLPPPALPAGAEFYFMPSRAATIPFYTLLTKLCLLKHRTSVDQDDVLLFSNKLRDLLNLCARLWRIDYPARAVCLYSAAHLLGILLDPLFAANTTDLGPINIELTMSVLQTCKRIVEEGKLDWEDKLLWPLKDQDSWVKHLGYTYSEVFFSIKDCLGAVLSTTVKPKFAPLLAFLGDYIESDALFEKLRATQLPTKWERKLSRALLRTAESLYASLLAALPRDNTVSIAHVLDIAEQLVENTKRLQKRYKHPLLGFLDLPKTYAAVVMGMFASDSKNILKHIVAHASANGQFLNYGDALEAYKTLSEIRSIYNQVSPNTKFGFDLEQFFYQYVEEWVTESGDKVQEFVRNALEEDSFEPMDLEQDDKKYSTSVHDLFTLIKHYLSILEGLNWGDRSQLAKIYTRFIKSISLCCLFYASEMLELVRLDLEDQPKAPQKTLEQKILSQPASGWFAEVKSMVTNQLGNEKIEVEPYNFTSRTCIGLNNLDAMMTHLSKLEDVLNPEEISQSMSAKRQFASHIFSIRIVKAENIKPSSDSTNLKPYVTLIDTLARKTIAKTRSMESSNPEWNEEFEITLQANTSITLSATVWEEKFGTHGVCGRALMQLEPRKFRHDGFPQDVYLDLDTEGRLHIEIAVESEREDAMFAMGRAHRALKRAKERITKMIVAKFSKFIRHCFSRSTLKGVCGNSGNIKPTETQMDEAMLPLYNYLNMNLLVLAQYLSKDLLMLVMIEAWSIVVGSADELLLPKLTNSRAIKLLLARPQSRHGWQSAMSSAMANVTNSLNQLGFGKTLTSNEIETVIGWVNFLCIDFFYNEGNGPPLNELKTDLYQSLLLIPVYYDSEVTFLKDESERLSDAYLQTLRDKNNVYGVSHAETAKLRSRAGSIARSLTIRANATVKARELAAKEARELLADPLVAQTSAENIILRLLLIKDEKTFVCRRLEQRERLAHTIATERLAKAAAEGTLYR